MLLYFFMFFMYIICLLIIFMNVLIRNLYVFNMNFALFVITFCRMKGEHLQINRSLMVLRLFVIYFSILFALLHILCELSFQIHVLYNDFILLSACINVSMLLVCLLMFNFRRKRLYFGLFLFMLNTFFTLYFYWSVVYLVFL